MKGIMEIVNRYNMLGKGCFLFRDMPVCLKMKLSLLAFNGLISSYYVVYW